MSAPKISPESFWSRRGRLGKAMIGSWGPAQQPSPRTVTGVELHVKAGRDNA